MVRVYQIYYDDTSKAHIEPGYIPYYNNPTTAFFESKVMADLISKGAHKDADYFGIVSHKLRTKISGSKSWGPNISNKSRHDFSASEFELFVRTFKPDIASYCTHPPHKVFPLAERYHRGICTAIIKIVSKLKYKVYYDETSRTPIYFNYFVARPNIYEDFVRTLLKPAIDLMSSDDEIKKLISIDTRYGNITPELSSQIGYNYYPLHPFICERLINLYLIKHNLRVIQW